MLFKWDEGMMDLMNEDVRFSLELQKGYFTSNEV